MKKTLTLSCSADQQAGGAGHVARDLCTPPGGRAGLGDWGQSRTQKHLESRKARLLELELHYLNTAAVNVLVHFLLVCF